MVIDLSVGLMYIAIIFIWRVLVRMWVSSGAEGGREDQVMR